MELTFQNFLTDDKLLLSENGEPFFQLTQV